MSRKPTAIRKLAEEIAKLVRVCSPTGGAFNGKGGRAGELR